MITQTQLKEFLVCRAEEGLFTWAVSPAPAVKVGSVAGTLNNRGYCTIGIKGEVYLAHRLVWLYVYGNFPAHQLDHINGVRNDNRLCNLREVTGADNSKNQGIRVNNTSGYKGVSWHKGSKKWQAECCVNRKKHYLGKFDIAEQASEAYQSFAKIHHKEFYNTGVK